MSERLAQRVMLVCWEGADWRLIHPLLDAGEMPHLAAIVESGVMGEMATLEPQLDPLLWASVATGRRADKHRVLSYLEPCAPGVRAVTRLARRGATLWSTLNAAGTRTHVLGWPGYPAEEVDGIATSQLFTRRGGELNCPLYERLPRAVNPARLADDLAQLRVEPAELGGAELLPFVPRAAEIDQEHDPGLAILGSWLAETIGMHNVATWTLAHEPWDFAAIHYDLLDRLGHAFMQFHPPRLPAVADAPYRLYRGVMNAAYRYADLMLGRLVELAGAETTVIVMSDHGFRSGADRPQVAGRGRSEVAWHSVLGILAMRGPAIRRDEWIWGATLLDIFPTVLTLFGLPLGEDLPGRPLLQAFVREPKVTWIASHEPRATDGEPTAAPAALSDEEAAALLQHLHDESYLDAEQTHGERAAAGAIDARDFNLAQVYLEQGRVREAAELLQGVVHRQPVPRFLLQLAQCKLSLGELDDCRRLVQRAIDAGVPLPHGRRILAQVFALEAKYEESLAELFEVEQLDPRQAGIHCQIGEVYVAMQRWVDASRAFRKEIELDADNALAHAGLGQVAIMKGDYEAAAESLLRSVSLWKSQPKAHYLLGTALQALGRNREAARAFERSLELEPRRSEARRRLADLYEQLGDQQQAARHRLREA
ncbi:MAG: alkaline phosphatase family protein [Pirellulales bacterium]